MASASVGPSSNGRRKSLDAELNLVPFIDLLSMCICFLLMTAVWMEIGGVNVKQLVGTEASSNDAKESWELDVKYTTPQLMEVGLKRTGARTQSFKVEGPTHEARVVKLREVIKNFAGTLKLNPAQDLKVQMGQAISVGRVTTKAGVTYGEVVSVMDALRDLGIVSLGLVPVRE